MTKYPVINMSETGKKIRESCESRGVPVRKIRDFLGLGSVQSVYDWFHGKTLPTVDNLLALSRLLGMRMEDLLAIESADENGRAPRVLDGERKRRVRLYMARLCRIREQNG